MTDSEIVKWIAIAFSSAAVLFLAVLLVRAYAEDRRQELLAKKVKKERGKH